MQCHNVFHISQLLEYRDGGRAQPPPPPLDFDDGEGGEWLEIDQVLTHRDSQRPLYCDSVLGTLDGHGP